MKAIAINNIGTITNTNKILREGVIMNLISMIMVKDNGVKNSSKESKRIDMIHDNGYNLYRNLEFGKRESKHVSRNIQMDICNRLV